MNCSRIRLTALVALAAFAVPGTAYAAWEEPKRIDTTSEDRGSTTSGDIAVGANGLATAFFFQTTDTGPLALFTRRASDAPEWSTPVAASFQGASEGESVRPDNPQPELRANDAGTAGVALRARRTGSDGGPLAGDGVVTTFGGGWPAAADLPSSLKQLLGGEDAPATSDAPQVDVDGAGAGHVVAIHDPAPTPGSEDPPSPPADPGPEVRYVQFNPATGDRTANTAHDDFVLQASDLSSDAQQPYAPASRPRIDVNEDGDVAVSFVARINPQQADDQQSPPNKLAVFAARRLKGGAWTTARQMSHEDEREDVTEHDVAIAPNGTLTVMFAADPERDDANRIYAHRWLHDAADPRNVRELVSSSAAGRPDASRPRAVADDAGNVTAAWLEANAQLFAAERTTNWNLPQGLSSSTASFDVAVDAEGTATIVYREGTNLKARQRATGRQWGEPDTISTTSVSDTVAPRVAAERPKQADAFFVQQNGSLGSAYAARFTGDAPATDPAPPLPGAEDCPADINVITGDDGSNSLTGTAERDTILGHGGDDSLFGRDGDDCLRGQDGDDSLDGDAGNDNVAGGNGEDRARGGEGHDIVDGGADGDTVDGDAGRDGLRGGAGNDKVNGGDGNDIAAGQDGDDRVHGGGGDDLLGGGEGADRIFGGADENTIIAGPGDDHVTGGHDRDAIAGGDGNDRVYGRRGGGTIVGEDGNDVLVGGIGREGISGGEGNDIITAHPGRDVAGGQDGDDTIYGGSDADKVSGHDGNDRVFGNTGSDRVYGGSGNDEVRGGSSRDSLFGRSGDDILNGDAGRDRIFANTGDDRVIADDGRVDRINCGGGRDTVTADSFDRVSGNCEQVKRVGPKGGN